MTRPSIDHIVDRLIVGLGLARDGTDSWSGALSGVKVPASAPAETIMAWRTHSLGPSARPAWRRASFDTLFFFHEGAPLHVIDADSGVTTLIGSDPAAGQVWQHSVPAGHRHRLAPGGPGYALWSEAYLSGLPHLEVTQLEDDDAAAELSAPPGTRPVVSSVNAMGLTAHIEGGYYRQIYESPLVLHTPAGPRPAANTIYYLLDRASPTGYLHLNVSDITHFLHGSHPVDYLMIAPDGSIHRRSLGLALDEGQVPAFTCPGGWWKTSTLAADAHEGLISEIVAPGFHFDDQRLADLDGIAADFPHLVDQLSQYIRH
jgi:hypothetical protein